MVDELDGGKGPVFIEEEEAQARAPPLRAFLPLGGRFGQESSATSMFTNHRGGLRASVVEGPGSEC